MPADPEGYRAPARVAPLVQSGDRDPEELRHLARRPQPWAVRCRRRRKWCTACVAVPRARSRMGWSGVPGHRRPFGTRGCSVTSLSRDDGRRRCPDRCPAAHRALVPDVLFWPSARTRVWPRVAAGSPSDNVADNASRWTQHSPGSSPGFGRAGSRHRIYPGARPGPAAAWVFARRSWCSPQVGTRLSGR